MQAGLLLFLWLELRISSTFIQNSLIHFFAAAIYQCPFDQLAFLPGLFAL